MPIYGLTDQSASIVEAGRLRLGPPKKEGLSELGYFRPDFRPGNEMQAAKFREIYGAKPTQINCRLPYTSPERNWDAYYTVYNSSGKLGQADGRKWLYLRDNKTDEVIVSDGLTKDGKIMPFDPDVPVYSYHSPKHKKDIAVFAKTTGYLNIYLPDIGGMVIVVHGIHSIIRLSKQMSWISEKSLETHVPLTWIPITVILRDEEIGVTINGHRGRANHYILNLTIAQHWLDAYDRSVSQLTPGKHQTLAFGTPDTLALPDTIDESELDESYDDGSDEQDTTSSSLNNLIDDLFAGTKTKDEILSYFDSEKTAAEWASKRLKEISSDDCALQSHIEKNFPSGYWGIVKNIAGITAQQKIIAAGALEKYQNQNPDDFGNMSDEEIFELAKRSVS